MNIVSRIGILAAVKTARELYPTEDEALEQVARQLCIPLEAIAEALNPASMFLEISE